MRSPNRTHGQRCLDQTLRSEAVLRRVDIFGDIHRSEAEHSILQRMFMFVAIASYSLDQACWPQVFWTLLTIKEALTICLVMIRKYHFDESKLRP